MRRAITVLTFLAALAAPAAAQAGGWATVALDPRPENLQAGDRWVVNLTVMQHGRTPLTGVTPAVILRSPKGVERRFAARSTRKPGVYRTAVAFPRPGTYTYTVDDGFTNAFPVKYPPIHVRGKGEAAVAAVPVTTATTTPPPSDPGFPWTLFLVSIGVLAVIGAGVGIALRQPGRRAAARAL